MIDHLNSLRGHMADFTIESFWTRRLPTENYTEKPLVRGWSFERSPVVAFQEAPLSKSGDLSEDSDPATAKVILVSAPGAVGKSTLAKQIAFSTKSIYVDLSLAEPVGGNSISGGLAKSCLFQEWKEDKFTLLIDGLDEARIRVTQASFESFLSDIADIADKRELPTVVFGRTGSIQDAWLFLHEKGLKPAVLEIGYYGPAAAIRFAEARVRLVRPNSPHKDVERQAIEALLSRLREATVSDGDRFAGYAPVLQAVAARVAQEENSSILLSSIDKGDSPVTLRSVVNAILERERQKLQSLEFEDGVIAESLYSSNEQLGWLASRMFSVSEPTLPAMIAKDAQTYTTALKTWVDEHPFLQGRASSSSAVFDAVVSVHALKCPSSAEIAAQRELDRGAAANPFLSEFYLEDLSHIPAEHVGVVYSSLRARLALGDSASLAIEGDDEEENLGADVEIVVTREGGAPPRVVKLTTDQVGRIRLGGYVENVGVSAPFAHVELGAGPQTILSAPIAIQCDKLSILGQDLVVESQKTKNNSIVSLEAARFDGKNVLSVPTVRGPVIFSCAWPGSKVYPWTGFVADPTPIEDPRIEESLRRFRKFVTAFRSHSKGNLARYRYKIEHARMTKGSGQSVLNLLKDNGIIYLSGEMYYLDPDLLGSATGATYADCAARKFSSRTVEFIKAALR